MILDINDSNIATVRGIKNCGQHNEENVTTPALQFAMTCDRCAGTIFITIWNESMQAQIMINRRG